MESGIPFTLESDGRGGTVWFNQKDLDFNEVAFVIDPDGAQGFDGSSLRLLVEDRPGKDLATVWASKRAAAYPSLKGNIVRSTPAKIHAAEQKLRKAAEWMRGRFAVLRWTHSDGSKRRMRVALANFGVNGGVPRGFLLQMVSDDPTKYGETVREGTVVAQGGTVVFPNSGDADSWPHIKFQDASDDLTLRNIDTGEFLHLVGTIVTGDYLDVDTFRETIYLNGLTQYPRSGFLASDGDMFPLHPGNNRLVLNATGGTLGVKAILTYRDAWA